MRAYGNTWAKARRLAWIQEQGGKCTHCGSTENLEIDHKNPQDKEWATRELWSRNSKFREAELQKCQVLCQGCHQTKTSAEHRIRNTGVPIPSTRKYHEADMALVLKYIEEGFSQRAACRKAGVCRYSFLGFRRRGTMPNIFK